MSNTIIIGDIAEGQKWFGEAEFLKQQLVNTYKNTNPYMSTWKQVTADVKIFVKMVNGIAQAFIYTEGGGLFVTFSVTGIVLNNASGEPSGEPYTGRLFYKDNLTPTKKDTYQVGIKGYWYSADRKESISWNSGAVYVKGVVYPIQTTSSIEHAAIKANRIIVLVNAVRYVDGTSVSTNISLSTFDIKADGTKTYISGSNCPINISVVDAYDFEISKDIKTVTLIAESAIYKIDILEKYTLGELIKVLELPPSASIKTNAFSWSSTRPVQGLYNSSASISQSTANDATGVGSIVTGRIVGRQYHYIYTVQVEQGNYSRSGADVISSFEVIGISITGLFFEIKEGYWNASDSSNSTTEDSIKIGIVDLDTLINTLDTETLYSASSSSFYSANSSSQYVPSGTYTHQGTGEVYQLTAPQHTASASSSEEYLTFSIVAFYPDKKVFVLKVNKNTSKMSASKDSSVGSTTLTSKIIIFKNDTVNNQPGTQKTYTYSLYKEILNSPKSGSSSGGGASAIGASPPVGVYGSNSGSSVEHTTNSTTITVDYDFSENGKILATKAIIPVSGIIPVAGTEKIVYQLILDIDGNIAEEYQASDQTIEGSDIMRRVYSTTT